MKVCAIGIEGTVLGKILYLRGGEEHDVITFSRSDIKRSLISNITLQPTSYYQCRYYT